MHSCVIRCASGTTLGDASEGKDALNISLSDSQAALLTQVAAVAKKPIVVVILTAVPLDISPLMANPKVGAILHTGQPSVTVLGIAELLYGHVSPAGRTIQVRACAASLTSAPSMLLVSLKVPRIEFSWTSPH